MSDRRAKRRKGRHKGAASTATTLRGVTTAANASDDGSDAHEMDLAALVKAHPVDYVASDHEGDDEDNGHPLSSIPPATATLIVDDDDDDDDDDDLELSEDASVSLAEMVKKADAKPPTKKKSKKKSKPEPVPETVAPVTGGGGDDDDDMDLSVAAAPAPAPAPAPKKKKKRRTKTKSSKSKKTVAAVAAAPVEPAAAPVDVQVKEQHAKSDSGSTPAHSDTSVPAVPTPEPAVSYSDLLARALTGGKDTDNQPNRLYYSTAYTAPRTSMKGAVVLAPNRAVARILFEHAHEAKHNEMFERHRDALEKEWIRRYSPENNRSQVGTAEPATKKDSDAADDDNDDSLAGLFKRSKKASKKKAKDKAGGPPPLSTLYKKDHDDEELEIERYPMDKPRVCVFSSPGFDAFEFGSLAQDDDEDDDGYDERVDDAESKWQTELGMKQGYRENHVFISTTHPTSVLEEPGALVVAPSLEAAAILLRERLITTGVINNADHPDLGLRQLDVSKSQAHVLLYGRPSIVHKMDMERLARESSYKRQKRKRDAETFANTNPMQQYQNYINVVASPYARSSLASGNNYVQMMSRITSRTLNTVHRAAASAAKSATRPLFHNPSRHHN